MAIRKMKQMAMAYAKSLLSHLDVQECQLDCDDQQKKSIEIDIHNVTSLPCNVLASKIRLSKKRSDLVKCRSDENHHQSRENKEGQRKNDFYRGLCRSFFGVLPSFRP